MANLVTIVIKASNQAKGAFDETSRQLKGLVEDGKVTKAEMAAAGAVILGTIAAIGTHAVTSFANFEAGMSKVKAVTGIAGEEFVQITDLARQLGATTVFTATEVADAMFEMGQAGFTAKEIMAGIPATLDLAAAGGLSIAQATEIASSTLRGFQIATEDTTRVVDVMAATAATSNASITDFGESMKYLAPTAHAFGIGLEEASAVVGILSNAGIKGSLATRALGTSLANLTKPTDAAFSMMEELGFAAFDATGNFVGMQGMIANLETSLEGLTQEQRMAAIATIFGAEAIQEINVLLAAGSEGLGAYTEQLMNSEGEAKRMAETMLDNLKGAFEQLSGAVDDLFITLGQMLAPTVRVVAQVLTVLANALGAAMKWFLTLPEPIQNVVKLLVGIVTAVVAGGAAWAVLTVTLGGFITAFMAIMSVVGTFLVAFAPIIAIVLAVSAAIYALYLAWTSNFLGIQDFVMAWVGDIVAMFQLIMFAWQTNMYGIQTIAKTVWDAITNIFRLFIGIFTGDWAMAWDAVKNLAKIGWDALTGLFSLGKDLVGVAWNGMVEGMKSAMSGAWEWIKGVFKDGINWVIDKLNSAIMSFNTIIGKVPGVGKRMQIPQIPRLMFGGIVPDIQSFTGGGVISGARGIDRVPVLATAGEVILNHAQQSNVARGLENNRGGGDLYIDMSGAQFFGDDERFIEKVADAVYDFVQPHLSHEAY